MGQAHPTLAVAATKLPKERLAQLDRLARRRCITRSRLLRTAIEELLDAAEEPLSSQEIAAMAHRRRDAELARRLGEINRRLQRRIGVSAQSRLSPEGTSNPSIG